MASSLAARIKEIFGTSPRLIEGHNGIYEVAINRQVVVTNQGKCGGIPTDEEILQEIRKHIAPLPGQEKKIVREVIPMMKG
jgi:predicted Rdx family selenoprotein